MKKISVVERVPSVSIGSEKYPYMDIWIWIRRGL